MIDIYIYTYIYIYIYMIFSKKLRSFSDNIYTGKININEADMDQTNLLENMVEFNSKFRPNQNKARIRNKTFSIV